MLSYKHHTTSAVDLDILCECVTEIELSIQERIRLLREAMEDDKPNVEGVCKESSLIDLKSHVIVLAKHNQDQDASSSPPIDI